MMAIFSFIRRYFRDSDGSAAVEASFIIPILIVLFFGTMDMGRAVMTNQKTIKASQVAADLITREIQVSDSDVTEAIDAATLSLQPYDDDNLEFDIISVRFLEDSTPEIVWRETTPGMTAINDVIARVTPIAAPGSGVVVVVARYEYEPIVAGLVLDSIPMEEVAFARGRRSEVVCRDGAPGCV